MKKVIDRVYEKVIILEQEIVSLKKKIIAEGCMEKQPGTTSRSTQNSAPNCNLDGRYYRFQLGLRN